VYTDPNTFVGADPNPNLDSDDEIAFMAKDAGGSAPTSVARPGGTVAGTGVQVALADPLDAGASGYVYLFQSAGGLTPSAGKSYVHYAFRLNSGNYKTTYNMSAGPNPEDSNVATDSYKVHFSDRWLNDKIRVTVGGSTGVDILDRAKALFAPGNCGRSEDTFDSAEGAFIANISGPVRAIRSYVGANSGPRTERTNIFYAKREDVITDLRVHPIPSIMDFLDYSPAASGMTYSSNVIPNGVTIDGVPDPVPTTPPQWEMVTGKQGSLVTMTSLATDISGLTGRGWYEDNKTTPTTQCTGDAFAYGSSGLYVTSAIPCTDPGLTSSDCGANAKHFEGKRVLYFQPPNLNASKAATLAGQQATPITTAESVWP
jgi:hypothetical protein